MTEYKLLRSRRRTLSLEVNRDGEVLVRAPMRCSRETIDAFIASKAQWIRVHREKQALRRAAHPEPDESQQAALIARAKAELPQRVARYAKEMSVSPAGIRITNAKGRFGSCSGKNRLCFSWRVLLYPDAAIHYVVVHELAHIVHKNHGRDFYALIAEVLPDYKERVKLLRE